MSFLKRLFRDPETLADYQATKELEQAAESSALVSRHAPRVQHFLFMVRTGMMGESREDLSRACLACPHPRGSTTNTTRLLRINKYRLSRC